MNIPLAGGNWRAQETPSNGKGSFYPENTIVFFIKVDRIIDFKRCSFLILKMCELQRGL